MDVFLEKIVSKRKTGLDYLVIILLFLAALIIFLAAAVYLAGLGLMIGLGAFYGAWYLSGTRSVEYEYSVTNGELDVDIIYAQRKRKRMVSAQSKSFEIFAPINAAHEQEFLRNKTNKNLTIIDARSSVMAEGAFFCVFSYKEKGRIMLMFEPDQRMVENFKTFNPRVIKES